MYCGQCGEKSSEGAKFCGKCGASLQNKNVNLEKETVKHEERAYRTIEPEEETQQTRRSTTKPTYRYAGFWLRAGALGIDFLIIFAFTFTVRFLFYPIRAITYDPVLVDTFQTLIIIAGSFLYFALMESSKWQATVGKKAVGLKVTDMNGRRISFGRATGRYFSKIVSGLAFYIGYIMASFTEKKQGLHDIMTSCLVLKEQRQEAEYRPSNEQSF
ncbi:RDD family protein [Priestia megaterium]|uniref:RDD family protein n=1 Tax=Priestia megaterium TaxID=1404 RepID=UPI002877A74C|nr:RDD family protein [Priestia megaterium]